MIFNTRALSIYCTHNKRSQVVGDEVCVCVFIIHVGIIYNMYYYYYYYYYTEACEFLIIVKRGLNTRAYDPEN